MNGRTVYVVAPEDDLWVVKLAGDSMTEYADSKEAAIERAKTLARRAPHGGVRVVGRDGRVEQEITIDPGAQRSPG